MLAHALTKKRPVQNSVAVMVYMALKGRLTADDESVFRVKCLQQTGCHLPGYTSSHEIQIKALLYLALHRWLEMRGKHGAGVWL